MQGVESYMNPDTFSQKEILLQLMTKMDTLNHAVNKQELLLNTIHEASANRDEKIRELREQVVALEKKVDNQSDKIQALKTFNKTIIAIWSGFILMISLFGRDLVNRIF